MKPFLCAIALCLVAACGSEETPPAPEPSKVASKPATPDPAPSVVAIPPEPEMDEAALLKRGRIVFLRCRSCHRLTKDGTHLTGPNLGGFYGKPAASHKTYAYSDALRNSAVTWNDEALHQWLAKPTSFIPGNRMVFAGLSKETDRKALIAYLKVETALSAAE